MYDSRGYVIGSSREFCSLGLSIISDRKPNSNSLKSKNGSLLTHGSEKTRGMLASGVAETRDLKVPLALQKSAPLFSLSLLISLSLPVLLSFPPSLSLSALPSSVFDSF